MTFYDGATQIGSSTLDASGVATLGIASLSVGVHDLSAVYAGDDNFAQATAPAVMTVNAAVATPAQPVPALSWWMLALLAGLMLFVARWRYGKA